jgi:GST-like protein
VSAAVIDLYTWLTSNGRKATIMLEEVELPYTVHPINISKGEQFAPEFVAINPNAKIPAMIDQDAEGGPFTVFESGAMLMYLGDKTGRLFPTAPRRRYEVTQWLMFQMGGIGPIFGQLHHFCDKKDAEPYAYGRYQTETRRLYGVLDARLADHQYLVDDYSIADIATFPWVFRHERHDIGFDDFPHLKRWFDAVHARPAVQRGLWIPKTD